MVFLNYLGKNEKGYAAELYAVKTGVFTLNIEKSPASLSNIKTNGFIMLIMYIPDSRRDLSILPLSPMLSAERYNTDSARMTSGRTKFRRRQMSANIRFMSV